MLVLKKVISSGACEVDIDYYVPFTIIIDAENTSKKSICWRTGNLKKSLIEISIDEESGILREVTLVSVDKAFLVNVELENADRVEKGVPVFEVNGNIRNTLCNHIEEFCVYLSTEFIMVKLEGNIIPYKYIELKNIQFGIGKDNRLVSIAIKDLSADDYNELRAGLKL